MSGVSGIGLPADATLPKTAEQLMLHQSSESLIRLVILEKRSKPSDTAQRSS